MVLFSDSVCSQTFASGLFETGHTKVCEFSDFFGLFDRTMTVGAKNMGFFLITDIQALGGGSSN